MIPHCKKELSCKRRDTALQNNTTNVEGGSSPQHEIEKRQNEKGTDSLRKTNYARDIEPAESCWLQEKIRLLRRTHLAAATAGKTEYAGPSLSTRRLASSRPALMTGFHPVMALASRSPRPLLPFGHLIGETPLCTCPQIRSSRTEDDARAETRVHIACIICQEKTSKKRRKNRKRTDRQTRGLKRSFSGRPGPGRFSTDSTCE